MAGVFVINTQKAHHQEGALQQPLLKFPSVTEPTTLMMGFLRWFGF